MERGTIPDADLMPPTVQAAQPDAKRVLATYVAEVERFWTGAGIRQARKLRSCLEKLARREGVSAAALLERVTEMADARRASRPPTVYVTGLGGSGSHWVAEMLN